MALGTRIRLGRMTIPSQLLGHDVVAAVSMDDSEGLLPQRHIVILRSLTKPDDRAFSTHYVAYQDGYGWTAHYGHYDMARDAAIADMVKREASER